MRQQVKGNVKYLQLEVLPKALLYCNTQWLKIEINEIINHKFTKSVMFGKSVMSSRFSYDAIDNHMEIRWITRRFLRIIHYMLLTYKPKQEYGFHPLNRFGIYLYKGNVCGLDHPLVDWSSTIWLMHRQESRMYPCQRSAT